MAALVITALALVTATLLATLGVLPWLTLSASFGEASVAHAGLILQVGVTALVLLLTVFIPSNLRVLKLETSHRNFRLSMEDILTAYEIAHVNDRAGGFALMSEFDSIRERHEYLRAHPDLEHLDGELLTVAAQMSHQSRDLARVYDTRIVNRVRDNLTKRRDDADALENRIQAAYAAVRDIRRDLDEVQGDEDAIEAQIKRLRAEVSDLIAAAVRPPDNSNVGLHLRSVTTGTRPAD